MWEQGAPVPVGAHLHKENTRPQIRIPLTSFTQTWKFTFIWTHSFHRLLLKCKACSFLTFKPNLSKPFMSSFNFLSVFLPLVIVRFIEKLSIFHCPQFFFLLAHKQSSVLSPLLRMPWQPLYCSTQGSLFSALSPLLSVVFVAVDYSLISKHSLLPVLSLPFSYMSVFLTILS